MTNEEENEDREIVILLSERQPVKIFSDEWPFIAKSKWNNGGWESYNQASRRARIFVREHGDGRRIVYGWLLTNVDGERNKRAGFILAAGDDVVRAIRRVAGVLGLSCLADDCIADLPAERI